VVVLMLVVVMMPVAPRRVRRIDRHAEHQAEASQENRQPSDHR
jgi:hypothetical protein